MTLRSRIAAAILIATLLAPLAPLPQPKRAQAIVPVVDVDAIAQLTEANITLLLIESGIYSIEALLSAIFGNRTTSLIQDYYEWAQTFVIAVLKDKILEMLSDQIVKFAQGGGAPAFVTDWKGFLGGVADVAIGDLSRELGLGFLCEPFNAQLKIALGFGLNLPRFNLPKFSLGISCTLDQIVGNIRNFYNDFRNGGFVAFNASWNPENNIYGSILMSWDTKSKFIAEKVEAAKNEALSGGGFLSTKKCRTDQFGEVKCTLTTPGDVIGGMVNKSITNKFDEINNVSQIMELIGSIASFWINKVVAMGAQGLLGAATPNAPAGGYVPPTAQGPCVGLTGAALALCQQYQRSQSGPGGGSNVFLSEIDEVLSQLSRATTTLGATYDTINRYVGNDLVVLRDAPQPQGFGGTTCPNRQTYLNEINAEVAWGQTQLLGLRTTENQVVRPIVDALVTARGQVVALLTPPPAGPPGSPRGPQQFTPDFAAINRILDDLRARGYLNIQAAINLFTQFTTLKGQMDQRVTDTLARFRSNLADCVANP